MSNIKKETCKRGDTLTILHESIKTYDGVLVTDFTNWKFQATLKASQADLDSAAVKILATSDFTVNSAENSAVGFMETESLSLALNTGYFLDAQIIDGNGNVATVLERVVEFTQDTGRRTAD